jgi:hypothetical protein
VLTPDPQFKETKDKAAVATVLVPNPPQNKGTVRNNPPDSAMPLTNLITPSLQSTKKSLKKRMAHKKISLKKIDVISTEPI